MTEQQREAEREALAALRFRWVEAPDDVWTYSPYHVDGLHQDVERTARAGIGDAVASTGPSPVGLVLQGSKGVGKTHLLGWVRREVQRADGYFFLIQLTGGEAFWPDTAEAIVRGLSRPVESGARQLVLLLERLCARIGLPDKARGAVIGEARLSESVLDEFVAGLRGIDHQVGLECRDTARALVLYASGDSRLNNIGEDYLGGLEESDEGGRQRWGIRPRSRPARELVSDMSRLLALTGPSVFAIDQIDTLVAKSTTVINDSARDAVLAQELALLADNLMLLRDTTRRTLSLLACLPNSWKLLRDTASDTVQDRFRETAMLGRISDPGLARALIARWVGKTYRDIGFTPPYATWPVAPVAFDDAWDEHTPRALLKRLDAHVESCLNGEIRELVSFELTPTAPRRPIPTPAAVPEPSYFAALDERFAELRQAAEIEGAVAEKTEDGVMPGLLSAALRCWITEFGNDDMEWAIDPVSDGKPVVHAELHRTLDEQLDVEEHWSFRAIASRHHIAALHRLRNLRSAAGVKASTGNRHLVLIRNIDWAKGPKTRAELDALTAAGGSEVKVSDDDLRTFSALREMLTKQSAGLREWLVARKPASSSALLSQVLPASTKPADSGGDTGGDAGGDPGGDTAGTRFETAITLGGGADNGSSSAVRIELESLRKHAVIFAGSGSGKTVLMRRIVEECALRGVSAIVLDPNNDLARLGEGWPSPPDGWQPGDERTAREYLAHTDVVVWTPGRSGGRPLSFHPLPDFAGVLDDEDEFTAAVEASVATLAPHAKITGNTSRASRSRAVLREALTYHARTGTRSLTGLIELLADLPDGVSQLGSGVSIAADLAETLTAATVNDRLFGGAGEPADPAVLFTPAAGKRARISVISFVGLPSEEQRQGFVNQLQLEIFAWVKRNPAGDRPLGGLLVMDEAQTLAPSGALTPSTHSTIMLASQARKYGLGLLFATQAPKGLHNQITGNATTQFFGRLNSPAQIAAANDMARAKGGTVGDISLLERGQFYVTGETFGFRRLRAPLCLSYHPPSPLRLEEVIERARNGRREGGG
jgi:uncharacterized protein DUF87